MVTVGELIKRAKAALNDISDTPQLDAEVILCNLLDFDRIQLYIYPEREISQEICRKYWDMIALRKSHMPIQYITRRQEFMGMDFYVDERVLIPRGDTEILVEEALARYLQDYKGREISLLDIGTGSGAIAVSLARLIEASTVYAIDISPDALAVAEKNAEALGVKERLHFRLGNLYEGISSDGLTKAFDFILSNPPYIPQLVVEGLAAQVKDFEPHLALSGGEDGLDYYRQIVAEAHSYLKPCGWLMLEIGYDQGEAVKALLLKQDFQEVRIIKDLAGLDRVVVGKNKPI